MQISYQGHDSEPSFLRKALILSDSYTSSWTVLPPVWKSAGFFQPVTEHRPLAGVLGFSTPQLYKSG